ncbi:MAG: hypothetical protein IRY85_22115 [Micromonosporaceae bacterium]|nr:hypothetical protein [Micromonosporaceae bacterium]
MAHLVEIRSCDPTADIEQIVDDLREQKLGRPVGTLSGFPAGLFEVQHGDLDELLRAVDRYGCQVQVVELGHYYEAKRLTPAGLLALLASCAAVGALAVGAAEVERAAQRRRLDLLIVCTDADADYRARIDAIVASTRYAGPRIVTRLSPLELGRAAGVKRASCIGLVRTRARNLLTDR